jgi:assimilatory nitrate reductase catalytic subunit
MPPDILQNHTETSVSEPRHQHLLRTGIAKAVFLQGVFPFAGRGFFSIHLLDESLTYEVPSNKRAELVYFRGGNLSDDLLYLTVTANGKPIRYFTVGPKGDFHVPLVITDSQPAGTRLQIMFAAPRALTGSIVVDAGFIEYPEGY